MWGGRAGVGGSEERKKSARGREAACKGGEERWGREIRAIKVNMWLLQFLTGSWWRRHRERERERASRWRCGQVDTRALRDWSLPADQVREAGWIRSMLRESPHLERCTWATCSWTRTPPCTRTRTRSRATRAWVSARRTSRCPPPRSTRTSPPTTTTTTASATSNTRPSKPRRRPVAGARHTRLLRPRGTTGPRIPTRLPRPPPWPVRWAPPSDSGPRSSPASRLRWSPPPWTPPRGHCPPAPRGGGPRTSGSAPPRRPATPVRPPHLFPLNAADVPANEHPNNSQVFTFNPLMVSPLTAYSLLFSCLWFILFLKQTELQQSVWHFNMRLIWDAVILKCLHMCTQVGDSGRPARNTLIIDWSAWDEVWLTTNEPLLLTL